MQYSVKKRPIKGRDCGSHTPFNICLGGVCNNPKLQRILHSYAFSSYPLDLIYPFLPGAYFTYMV